MAGEDADGGVIFVVGGSWWCGGCIIVCGWGRGGGWGGEGFLADCTDVSGHFLGVDIAVDVVVNVVGNLGEGEVLFIVGAVRAGESKVSKLAMSHRGSLDSML